jgi:hypothetical protein
MEGQFAQSDLSYMGKELGEVEKKVEGRRFQATG